MGHCLIPVQYERLAFGRPLAYACTVQDANRTAVVGKSPGSAGPNERQYGQEEAHRGTGLRTEPMRRGYT